MRLCWSSLKMRGVEMPTCIRCEICKAHAGFTGFGHVFCWLHYSQWLMSYRESSRTIEEDVRHPQINLPLS